MPSPSLTYTLVNGATADASQVMQNFNDLLNGYTDATKDLSISALTVASTATFNGAVNLGNATGDDISFTGYIASSLIPKTAATSDFGTSTQTWRAIYIDNSATDGGAIYFNAGTTDFIKCNAAGTDLSIGGMDTINLNDAELKGRTDGASATAGYVGERLVTEKTGNTTINNAVAVVCSVTLTAGVWLVGYHASCNINAGVAAKCQISVGGTINASTVAYFAGNSLAGSVTQSITRMAIVSISSSVQYDLEVDGTGDSIGTIYGSDLSGSGSLADPENSTAIWGIRIA